MMMSIGKKRLWAFVLVLSASLVAPAAETRKTPLTTAEATDFKATSRFEDVRTFIRDLQRRTAPLIRVETLCTSTEGRDIPLLIIGNPAPLSPLDLRSDSRRVVYIQANIHAGEVEGKEASLMLARDILLEEPPPYLDKLVLLIAPILNADGNEKISPLNRSYQPGPEQGVGTRPNGQNLDLNRDAVKLESPEVRGLVRNVLNRWDPLLLVDCHTTDGSYHEETVTWAWPVNPNGDIPLLEYQRETMLPAVNRIMKEKYGILGLPHGDFRDIRAPEKGWQTVDPQPRFITNYAGLRNRLAILDENYAHTDFKTRVLHNYGFLRAILDYTAAHSEEIALLAAEADRRTIRKGSDPGDSDLFGIEFDVKPLVDPVTILGFETEIIDEPDVYPETKKTDRKKTFKIPFFAEYVPKRSVPFPFAYLIPAADAPVVANLLNHGIVVEKLEEPAKLEVQTFLPKEINCAERIFQGHYLNSVSGDYVSETREFPPGTFVVRTAQPLGKLAAYLLEPESDDGLFVWNFFDRDLVAQWSRRGFLPYPVRKRLERAKMVTVAVGEE